MAATSTRTEDGKVRNLNVKNKTLFSKFTPIFLLLSQPRIQDRRDDRVPVAQSNFKKFSTFALSLSSSHKTTLFPMQRRVTGLYSSWIGYGAERISLVKFFVKGKG